MDCLVLFVFFYTSSPPDLPPLVSSALLCSGHRLGTAEIENAITSHPDVIESAVVGDTPWLTCGRWGRIRQRKGGQLPCWDNCRGGISPIFNKFQTQSLAKQRLSIDTGEICLHSAHPRGQIDISRVCQSRMLVSRPSTDQHRGWWSTDCRLVGRPAPAGAGRPTSTREMQYMDIF